MIKRIILCRDLLTLFSSIKRFGRLVFLLVMGIGCSATQARAWSASTWKTPNVLLIIADDLGAENVGEYKDDFLRADPPATPNLDALANAGVRFRNAWGFPVCSPSRAAIYTGCFPMRTGVGRVVVDNDDTCNVLSTDETTYPELVISENYSTALIGKWHLGTIENIGGYDAPRRAGFGRHSGFLSGGVKSYFKWTRYEDGIKSTKPIETYITTSQVDSAIDWISSIEKPWILTIATLAPHEPFHIPPKSLYTSDLSDIKEPSLDENTMRRCYKAAIEVLDTELGRLLDYLESQNQLANTMVIFTADNGTPTEVLDSGRERPRSKYTIYQCGVTVPLIIAGPKVVNGGRVEDALVSVTDIFATIVELAGQEQSTGIDSVTLMPYLTDNTHFSARDWVYTEHFYGSSPDNGVAAIRDNRYKLIERQGEISEFYDLKRDPEELYNLIDMSRLPSSAQASYDTLKEQLNTLHGH